MKTYDATSARKQAKLELKRIAIAHSQPLGPRAPRRSELFRPVEDGCVIAGIDCSTGYICKLQDINGAVVNAIITLIDEDHNSQQVYVPGCQTFGVFSLFGSLDGLVLVTLDVQNAVAIHLNTNLSAIAVNSVENMARVCA